MRDNKVVRLTVQALRVFSTCCEVNRSRLWIRDGLAPLCQFIKEEVVPLSLLLFNLDDIVEVEGFSVDYDRGRGGALPIVESLPRT